MKQVQLSQRSYHITISPLLVYSSLQTLSLPQLNGNVSLICHDQILTSQLGLNCPLQVWFEQVQLCTWFHAQQEFRRCPTSRSAWHVPVLKQNLGNSIFQCTFDCFFIGWWMTWCHFDMLNPI